MVSKPCGEYELMVFHETERAYLVGESIEDRDRGKWLPKSQVEVGEKRGMVDDYEVFVFTVPDWLAEQKGLV